MKFISLYKNIKINKNVIVVIDVKKLPISPSNFIK